MRPHLVIASCVVACAALSACNETSSNNGARCNKRGIATNAAPSHASFASLAWWYNWALQSSDETAAEFVPMVWGKASLASPLPASSTNADFVLGFNEPNFHEQSNLTAAEAAAAWPMVEALAGSRPIVSPAMNFCGPAQNCNGTNPYQYLKDFFAACPGCRVDYVAVHWYNCDLPSLRDYLEPGGNLEGFEQFGKPIWLTEFSCDGQNSVAQQQAFMALALPYLDANPQVFRYAWFSANPIPTAELIADDGSPTTLGHAYLDAACD